MTDPTTQQPDLDAIQSLDLLALMDDRAAATVSGHLAALLAEVRRLRAQRKFLLHQIAKKDAASGEADRKVREFLAAGDPICGDENDDEVCELEPGHDGDHQNGYATVGWHAV